MMKAELRKEITANICSVLGCDADEISELRALSGGQTNETYHFSVRGSDYVYRHPGDGTENIINRKAEKEAIEAASALGLDQSYIHMDEEKGWKISKFVPDFRNPDYGSDEDSSIVIRYLRHLHSAGIKVEYERNPWAEAQTMEDFLRREEPARLEAYIDLKDKVRSLYSRAEADGVKKCLCHCDANSPNWMLLPDGSAYLIDWEYAGFADPGIDVGFYIAHAMYDSEQSRRFIREYLGSGWSEALENHYLACAAVISYYWLVWVLYMEHFGAELEEDRKNMYERTVFFCNEALA